MQRIQLVAIAVSLSFLAYVLRQIQKGRLREEYAFIWIVSTFALILFSFWRNALELLAHLFGVHDPPNLLFTGAIMATLSFIYCICHLQFPNFNTKIKRLPRKLHC